MFTGSRLIQVRDEGQNLSFPAVIMYPTDRPSTPTTLGPYTIDISPDAPLAQGRYPLVVVSHGNGGTHLLHRTIGTHLAKNGYVVAMLEHPGNNYKNNELEGTDKNLANRPRHVSLTIDAVLSDAFFSSSIQRDAIAIMGHSMGGYTALAASGGTPWTEDGRKIEVVPDPRLRALVLLAPATPWFRPMGSLSKVTVPILLLTAEHDSYTPGWQSDLVLNGVADRSRVTYRVVENADHFSFLSPFPSRMKSPAFPPSTDPEGFDREAFHQMLPGEIRDYLDRTLKTPHNGAATA